MPTKDELKELKKKLEATKVTEKPNCTKAKAESKKYTIGVIPDGPGYLDKIKKAVEGSAKRMLETQQAWEKSRKQSEPVCCFCHKPKYECCYLIQGYAPDKRPIFICSDCILYSIQILQRNDVKVGPTF